MNIFFYYNTFFFKAKGKTNITSLWHSWSHINHNDQYCSYHAEVVNGDARFSQHLAISFFILLFRTAKHTC